MPNLTFLPINFIFHGSEDYHACILPQNAIFYFNIGPYPAVIHRGSMDKGV